MKLIIPGVVISTATIIVFLCGVVAQACWSVISNYEQADL